MQFLKILFWCLLTFLAAIFTYGNWDRVEIHLWGGLVADVNLPLLLLVVFLLGWLPMLMYHHAVRWRLRQRLATCERMIAETRALPAVMPAPVIATDRGDRLVPASGTPVSGAPASGTPVSGAPGSGTLL